MAERELHSDQPVGAPVPKNEAARLAALHQCNLLDSEAESQFDDLTRLAARICRTPTALITLIDADRQWFKSRHGMACTQTPRDQAFCGYVLTMDEPMIVPDARLDERFATNPLVTHEPYIRFYAGAPLTTPAGYTLGTLCVIDYEPGHLTLEQSQALEALARQVVDQINLREELAAGRRTEAEVTKLSLVASRTDNAVIITDPAGCIEWVNDGFTRLTEYDFEEASGRKPGDLLQGPDTDPDTIARIREHLRAGEGFSTEIVNYSKAGRPYWLAMDVQPVRDEAGRLTNFIAIESDITERKRTERELRHSEERQRLILDTSLEAVITIDTAGTITHWNHAAEVTFGWSQAEAVGGDLAETIIPERFREAHKRGLAHYLATGEGPVLNQRLELAALRRNGEEFPCELTISPLQYGDQIAFSAFLRDITERRQHEDALKRTNAILQAQQKAALDGILVVDENRKILHYNDRFLDLWEISPASAEQAEDSQLIAMVLSKLAEPEAFEEKVDYLYEHPAETSRDEIRLRDGRVFDRYSGPMTSPEGDSLGRVWYFRDVTAQKRAERDLREAKDQAESANHAKSAFLANMSHEIRTPLNGVVGMVELLSGTEVDERQQRYLDVASQSAESLLSLINDILDFSKIEAGKLELEAGDFDLHQTIENVMQMFTQRAEKKGLELACYIDPALPPGVCGDADRLRQVIVNLVSNALKFTDSGAVTVRARVEQQAEADLAVRLSVTDTGAGIAADKQSQLFQSFSQLDASTTRQFGGTGLGLAICRQLVELMGGAIGVESEAGAGSTFWFTARLDYGEDTGETRPARFGDVKNLSVLVVDDNATNREILGEQLSSWHMRPEMVADAWTGFERLRSAAATDDPFDLAILDEQMPERSGLELARQIHEDPALSGTPMLLLTSIGDLIERDRLEQTGIGQCLTKPVLQSNLFDAVMEAVGTVRSPASPGERDRAHAGDATAAPPARSAAGAGSVHLLLAEDNEVNQMVTREIVQKGGHTCDVVANGEEAVHAVQNGAYSLLLMDCQMPVMDGFAATAAIRRRETQQSEAGHTPIIALTAGAVKGDREQCIEAGMDDYLSKPIDAKALLALIEQHAIPAQPAAAGEPVADAHTDIETDHGAAASGPLSPRERAGVRATPITHGDPASPQPDPLPKGEGTGEHPDPDARSAETEPSETSVTEPAALNVEALLDRCMGDAALLEQLLGKLETDGPPAVRQLSERLDHDDVEPFTREAHALKGLAGNLGAERLSELAAELEQSGRAHDLSGAAAQINQLQAELTRCIEAVPAAVANAAERASDAA